MRLVALALALGLAAAPTLDRARADSPAPAPPAEITAVTARHAMVSAANPLAAQAGLKILKAGGNALDAAVAVQATLGLVEPQSSGLGGGSFLIYYDAKTGRTTAYDGRETAPAGATPDMFLGVDGKPMPFVDAILSGRSTGFPAWSPCWPWRTASTASWPGATSSARASGWRGTASWSPRAWRA